MRPKDLFKIWGAAFVFSFFFFITGCINEDLSHCGVGIRFKYTKNVDGVDKLASEIKKINIYVFDSDSILVGEYIIDADQLDGTHTARLNIPPGRYSFVAWGNVGDDYELPVFVKGKTTLGDAVLSLKRTGKTVSSHPSPLFFGSIASADVQPALSSDQVLTIDMIKDTKKIRVIAKGLPAKEIAAGSFSCRITSANGDYKFDNSLGSDEELLYLPSSSADEMGRMISDFVVMRELKDGSTGSRLVFTYHGGGGRPSKEVFAVDLTELLLARSKTKDLDIEDYFEIELTIDITNAGATVHIKGWDTVYTAGDIG
ncbi:MAG: FimB/Mfa2 family fimbrial subunit [Tannerellaceae bacterium]|jgi:hypothetical protein|nr:FimB/Mfa2 family fimbrial subunit [Tannerellaceae bacterium]